MVCATFHSTPSATHRYILVDWLFEVAEMKEFPPETVHLAVSLVDRYLQLRDVKRTKLQLVGISAILLAARWMGPLIITIREAAWLTDNTYKYEQVVRMMGEVLAVFRGDLRVCLRWCTVCRICGYLCMQHAGRLPEAYYYVCKRLSKQWLAWCLLSHSAFSLVNFKL